MNPEQPQFGKLEQDAYRNRIEAIEGTVVRIFSKEPRFAESGAPYTALVSMPGETLQDPLEALQGAGFEQASAEDITMSEWRSDRFTALAKFASGEEGKSVEVSFWRMGDQPWELSPGVVDNTTQAEPGRRWYIAITEKV